MVKVFRDTNPAKYNAREIMYLSEISHDNIVSFYGVTRNKESNMGILLEYSECGSLHDCLHKPKDGHVYSYDFVDALRWMHQLAKVRFILYQC